MDKRTRKIAELMITWDKDGVNKYALDMIQRMVKNKLIVIYKVDTSADQYLDVYEKFPSYVEPIRDYCEENYMRSKKFTDKRYKKENTGLAEVSEHLSYLISHTLAYYRAAQRTNVSRKHVIRDDDLVILNVMKVIIRAYYYIPTELPFDLKNKEILTLEQLDILN